MTKINITLNNDRDGFKIITSYETEEDGIRVERIVKALVDKIETIKVNINQDNSS